MTLALFKGGVTTWSWWVGDNGGTVTPGFFTPSSDYVDQIALVSPG